MKCKIRETLPGVETIFVNPKCKHKQEFKGRLPYYCQNIMCFEKLVDITKLYGKSTNNRIKFYISGEISYDTDVS